MTVFGIGGSPRKDGLTDNLLDKALAGAGSAGAVVKKLILNDLDFKPCLDCGGCGKKGVCVIDDDMRILYREFESADAVIIASPIFFGSVTAQLKAMIDRFQSAWVSKYVLRKARASERRRKGVFLCAAGQDNRKYFENARQIIRILFATLDIDYAGELFLGGSSNVKAKNSKKKEAALKKAFELGRALVE